jgi:glyoxylase-like metal-dependent hydrolase (beta-lactamase superfamily II)
MKVGRYTVRVHNFGFFRLDGGAMFGAVPKALWNKEAPADEQNRILLATRSLVIEDGDRKMVVDLGCGDKWSEKNRSIFCLPNEPYLPVPGITDVLLTHLHFDHVGGISRLEGEDVVPNYPAARHYVSSANYENGQHPNVRERASYLPENIGPLSEVALTLTSDGDEIWPGLTVHVANGHTRGLQWVKLTDGGTTIAFPSDINPTSKHLPIPFVMGYDMCAEVAMEDKRRLLTEAAENRWIIVFEHDPDIDAGRIEFDDRGRPRLVEQIEIS